MEEEKPKSTKMIARLLFLKVQIAIVSIVLFEIVVLGFISIGWSLLSPWLAPLIMVVVIAVVVGCVTLLNQLWRRCQNSTNRLSKTKIVLLFLASVSGFAPTWFWYIQVFDNHNFNFLAVGSLALNAAFTVVSASQIVRSSMQFSKSK